MKPNPGPKPLVVFHFDGRFVRCYDPAVRSRTPNVRLALYYRDKMQPLFDVSLPFGILTVDGVTVATLNGAITKPGRKYPGVIHYFIY